MTQRRILVARHEGVRTVTIDAPERLGAVTEPMLRELGDAVIAHHDDDRVIVVRGTGRGFCAGADLAESDDLAEGAEAMITAANRLIGAISSSPLPVVAVVQGPCAGVGVSIALAADVTIASTAAFFQVAFTRIGLMPDGGATALIAASVGRSRALRLALLAERLGAEEAVASGLIAAAVAPEDLDAEARAIVSALNGGAANALAHTKRAINAATLAELDGAFTRELSGQTTLLNAADFSEGARAFADKRAPRFTDAPA